MVKKVVVKAVGTRTAIGALRFGDVKGHSGMCAEFDEVEAEKLIKSAPYTWAYADPEKQKEWAAELKKIEREKAKAEAEAKSRRAVATFEGKVITEATKDQLKQEVRAEVKAELKAELLAELKEQKEAVEA